MRLLPLGVGDAFSRRWYSSCAVVEAEGARLLIDCPHPIRKILHEGSTAAGTPLDVGDLAGVVLTHLHADHASGVEGLAYFNAIALGRPTALLAHPLVSGPLWDHTLHPTVATTEAEDGRRVPVARENYFEVHDLDESRPLAFGPFTIACRRTRHGVPTFALRLSAGGRTLGWSSDTAFDPDLIAWLAAADLVVHETNLGPHTPYESLAALPAELRARMRLIHYTDDFDRGASVIAPLEPGVAVAV
jgi:ribonuclease BN (tRNA processing enzyme)